MLRQRTILFFLIVLSFKMTAQSSEWKSTGMPFYGRQVRYIYNDTLNNLLYVSGQIMVTPTSFSTQRVCKYDGSTWTSLGIFDDQVLSVVNYKGDLIVAGFFHNISGVPYFSIARYDGSSWHPMGNFDIEVTQLRVIDTNLYAMGYFNSVDGIPAKRIAKWNGSIWTDVHGFSADTMDGHIEDVAIYKGNTYVCGNFSDSAHGINHLAVYKSGSWQNVGGGILGSWTDLTKLVVYQNQLHLCGRFLKPDGNIGNGIQKWNDTIWSEVGAGVQDFSGSYGSTGTIIYDATIHNNELYIAGCFGYAGHVPTYCAAKWDGLKWCGLATTGLLTNITTAINFYNDTLYLGIANDTLNGVFTNRILKYVAGNYVDTCSINYTGINESQINNESLNIYPNPATNHIAIEFDLAETKNTSIEIKNVLGQTIKTISNKVFSKGTNKIEIDVSEFSNGIYFVELLGDNKVIGKKIIKQ